MRELKDLAGMMFGKWLVKELIGKKEGTNHYYWLCECQCENKTTKPVREDSLLKGETNSCGCDWHKNFSKYHEDKCPKHNMSGTRFYRIWSQMKRRCYDKHIDSYPHYGGRGIQVCERWRNNFLNFKEDMYNSYLEHSGEYGEDDTSLDRIDPNKNYCPENCRWATCKEQSNNKTNTTYIEYNGDKKTLSQWCDELNLVYSRVVQRLEDGWRVEDAFLKENLNPKHKIEYNGEIKSLRKWCIDLEIESEYNNIKYRMSKMGMTFEEAINKPTGRWS